MKPVRSAGRKHRTMLLPELEDQMSFMQDFSKIMWGVCRWCFDEYARQQRGASVPEPSRYDFETHMRELSIATGIPITFLSSTSAVFAGSIRGNPCHCWLVWLGEKIAIHGVSSIWFPKGEIPPQVLRAIT